MDSRSTDRTDEPAVAETPEDVAVLYSWANLHGAKYRDFSASRREYRAQLRHRAAEQVREQALLAQAEAEAAAAAAESAARQAAHAARSHQADDADSSMRRALREAEEAARTAAAERVEAARRAEAAAVAEAAARREEREIAEAHASAQRQAARYADSEMRRRASSSVQQAPAELPGVTSDPYTGESTPQTPLPSQPSLRPAPEPAPQQNAVRRPNSGPAQIASAANSAPTPPRRPERRASIQSLASPSGLPPRRRIRSSPDLSRPRSRHRASRVHIDQSGTAHNAQFDSDPESRSVPASTTSQQPTTEPSIPTQRSSFNANESQAPLMGQRSSDPQVHTARPPQTESATASPTTGGQWPPSSGDHPQTIDPVRDANRREVNREVNSSNLSPAKPLMSRPLTSSRVMPSAVPSRPVSPFSQALVPSDSTRGRRAQDDFDYQQSQGFPERRSRTRCRTRNPLNTRDHTRQIPPVPHGSTRRPLPSLRRNLSLRISPVQSSVADTLQHSRERVAARWFALKGVFEQPGQEQPEATPVRQKETRTPVLAVFSLAGGVGKTSPRRDLGRALSSMGEKVLLTDTTSHGLLALLLRRQRTSSRHRPHLFAPKRKHRCAHLPRQLRRRAEGKRRSTRRSSSPKRSSTTAAARTAFCWTSPPAPAGSSGACRA